MYLLSMHIPFPRTSTRDKNLTIFTFFVTALFCVQKRELPCNVLGMTQNCIPLSEFIIPNRKCVIQLGIGEGANVMFNPFVPTIPYMGRCTNF